MDAKISDGEAAADFIQERVQAGEAATVDGNGRTMLYLAAYLNDVELVQKLLAEGLRPDRPDNYGTTAMDIALQYGSMEALAAMREATS
jgi:ankyrin repeat protein